MLIRLLKKEFSLALHPTAFIYLLFASFVFIPGYPYEVMFFFSALSVFFICMIGRENGDLFFTCILPVNKKGIAFSRILTAVLLQLCMMAIAGALSVLKRFTLPTLQNMAGLEANFTLFGMGFLMFALFNLIFSPLYFKNPNKVGKPFLLAAIPMFLIVISDCVLCAAVPFVKTYLDTINPAFIGYRLCVFFVGMAIYVGGTALACKLSMDNFNKVDL